MFDRPRAVANDAINYRLLQMASAFSRETPGLGISCWRRRWRILGKRWLTFSNSSRWKFQKSWRVGSVVDKFREMSMFVMQWGIVLDKTERRIVTVSFKGRVRGFEIDWICEEGTFFGNSFHFTSVAISGDKNIYQVTAVFLQICKHHRWFVF